MDIGSQTRVADIATEHPATMRVFQRHGIELSSPQKLIGASSCRMS